MKRSAGGLPSRTSISLSSLTSQQHHQLLQLQQQIQLQHHHHVNMASSHHHSTSTNTTTSDNPLFAVLASSAAHEGVTCDGCSTASFSGIRHKCSICFDYDLCDECYLNGVATKSHDPSHAMQTLLPPSTSAASGISDFETYIAEGGEFEVDQLDLATTDSSGGLTSGGTSGSSAAYRSSRFRRESPPRTASAIITFKCPYCGADGFLEQDLCYHVNSAHAGDSTPVVCPICAAKPGGDPMYVSRNFHGHLELRHLQSDAKAGLFASGNNAAANALLSNPTSRLISELAAPKATKNPPAKVARLSNLPPIPVKITPPATTLLPSLEPALTEEETIESNNKKILKGIFLRELLYSTLVEPPKKPR